MTSVPFVPSWDESTNVKYGTGQGMGAYGSWSIGLALYHHLVIRVAGYYAFKHFNFNDYLLLGDDVVIFDAKVARVYKR